MPGIVFLLAILFFNAVCSAAEYHVAVKGNDNNSGTQQQPFRTINHAAQIAEHGDIVTVHAGTYREYINPARGGESDTKRIVYRAAEGEHVEVKGSERMTTWERVQDKPGVWKVVLPNTFFGNYNPYQDIIKGGWFEDKGRKHHTGEVFLNGKSFYEKATIEEVFNPQPHPHSLDKKGSLSTWYCETDEKSTTIWANFHDANPNTETVEISVRPTIFYPATAGINYLTIQGFHFSQAATQWSPPNVTQVGIVATNWSKGWIIENNTVSNSKCAGITLGDVVNKSNTIPWNRETVGSHIVRNNEVYDCEQSGICGCRGGAFSLIENNLVHDIYMKRQFAGSEQACIKFHYAIDIVIRNNCCYHSFRGIWLDWGGQGARISSNLLFDNDWDDMMFEMVHGPYLVDNNIFGSSVSFRDWSRGGAYVHNLFAGAIEVNNKEERRPTLYQPHSTEISGGARIQIGDNRFYNNIFLAIQNPNKENHFLGLGNYADKDFSPSFADGNVYFGKAGTNTFPGENVKQVIDEDSRFKIEQRDKNFYLSFSSDAVKKVQERELVTAELLGKTELSGQDFGVTVDKDYFGKERSEHPAPGPFETLGKETVKIKVR
ncbi:hypothetical protein FACS189419_06660 [Planctomycetales bacterium]|nr:hypothetical protein FACS189419_06660 [Planctomycetales bacterium]